MKKDTVLIGLIIMMITCAKLCAGTLRTQGRFFDFASDHKITVAYIYEGCRHEKSAQCPTRRPVYHANKKIVNNVSCDPELRTADVFFMTIDSSRYRVKNIAQLLSIAAPDTFIIFIDGIVASYEYLTGSPTEEQLLAYIHKVAGEALRSYSTRQDNEKNECDNRCNASRKNTAQNPSWYTPGYYGVMGGPPPLGYGMGMSGYSFSMGYRMSPFMY